MPKARRVADLRPQRNVDALEELGVRRAQVVSLGRHGGEEEEAVKGRKKMSMAPAELEGDWEGGRRQAGFFRTLV